MAAPTLISVSFAQSSIATGANQTTPTSVSWQTSDVVVVLAGTEGNSSETWVAPTTNGTGLTFAPQQVHASASNCGAGLYTAVASAPSSGTFSLKQPVTGAGLNAAVALSAFVVRGSAGVGASAIAASATRTLALIPTGPDGLLIWGVFDWSAAAVVAATPTATTHSTAAPGPQASPQAAAVTGLYTYYVEELDDQTSAGSVSYGVGGTGTGPFTIVALEVKASAAAASSNPAAVRAVQRVAQFRSSNF